jgi:hypothetical protein
MRRDAHLADRTPTIFMSAAADDAAKEGVMKAGAVGIVSRSVSSIDARTDLVDRGSRGVNSCDVNARDLRGNVAGHDFSAFVSEI